LNSYSSLSPLPPCKFDREDHPPKQNTLFLPAVFLLPELSFTGCQPALYVLVQGCSFSPVTLLGLQVCWFPRFSSLCMYRGSSSFPALPRGSFGSTMIHVHCVVSSPSSHSIGKFPAPLFPPLPLYEDRIFLFNVFEAFISTLNSESVLPTLS